MEVFGQPSDLLNECTKDLPLYKSDDCIANELSTSMIFDTSTLKHSKSQDDGRDSLFKLPPFSILRRRGASSKLSQVNIKRVNFDRVDLYHFDRLQGFTCVPSQGGSTLGMAMDHWNKDQLSVIEHQKHRRQQRNAALLRFCLEGKLLLSFQQFRVLERRVKLAAATAPISNDINKPISQAETKFETDSTSTSQSLIVESSTVNNSGAIMKEVSLCEVGRGLKRKATESTEFQHLDESNAWDNTSEDDLSFLESLEEYYFLQPLPVKKRRVMLRRAGLQMIDGSEKAECQAIRESRTKCGCDCANGICDPQSCQCALSGISCQVDRINFPCSCVSPSHCNNPSGRIEFNPMRVKTHYLHTRMRLELERQDEEEASARRIEMKRTKVSTVKTTDESVPSTGKNEIVECTADPAVEFSSAYKNTKFMLDSWNTTSQGSCRDCQNDRYMQVLMQELVQRESCLQVVGGNQEAVELNYIQRPTTSPNLAVECQSIEKSIINGNMTFQQSNLIELGQSADRFEFKSSFTDSHNQCFLENATNLETCSDQTSDIDDDDDEDDEDEGNEAATKSDSICITAETIDTSIGAVIVAPFTECMKSLPPSPALFEHKPDVQMKQSSDPIVFEEATNLHTCRLEPISSLFHNSIAPYLTSSQLPLKMSAEENQEVSDSAQPYELVCRKAIVSPIACGLNDLDSSHAIPAFSSGGNHVSQPANPSRPPSANSPTICEVVSA